MSPRVILSPPTGRSRRSSVPDWHDLGEARIGGEKRRNGRKTTRKSHFSRLFYKTNTNRNLSGWEKKEMRNVNKFIAWGFSLEFFRLKKTVFLAVKRD